MGTQPVSTYDVLQARTLAAYEAIANLPFINLRDAPYSLAFDGVSDDTALWQAAVNALPNGGTILAPPGISLVTDQINITGGHIRIIGAGEQSTIIKFQPTVDGKAVFCFDHGIAGALAYNALIGFSFLSTDTTHQKIMVKFVDCEEIELAHLASAETNWTGNTSIGIQSFGRQTLNCHDIAIATDLAMDWQVNPRLANAVADHYHIWNFYAIGNNNPIIRVASGGISNITFDGYQAWVKGTDGFVYTNNSGIVSLAIKFENVRREQEQSATAYMFSLGGSTAMSQLDFFNVRGGLSSRGWLLRNTSYTNFRSTFYAGTGIALDMDSTCKNTRLENAAWNPASSANITGQTVLWRFGTADSTQPIETNAIYQTNTATFAGISLFNGSKMVSVSGTVGSGVGVTLPLGLAGSERSMLIIVSAVNNVTGLPEGGMAIVTMTGGGATNVGGTANWGTGVGKIGIFWSNATTIQLFNQLAGGATADYTATVIWK